MRKYAEKWIRDTKQGSMINMLRSQLPNYDSYLSRHRFPAFPRIVLYSNHNNPSQYLENVLPLYRYFNPGTVEGDLEMARKVAEEVLVMDPYKQQNGVFIHGFPYNVKQALHLDQFLGGVNLAIYMSSGNEYKESIDGLLQYYHDRGALYEMKNYEDTTPENLERIRREIIENIKLSEE